MLLRRVYGTQNAIPSFRPLHETRSSWLVLGQELMAKAKIMRDADLLKLLHTVRAS